MRTLTSIQSSTNINVSMQIDITPTDGTPVITFTNNDIQSIDKIMWNGDVSGGMSAPSNYKVTVSSSLDGIKGYINRVFDSSIKLTVIANSDSFVPHVGRVKSINRPSSDPNLLDINVYDEFLESRTSFPVFAIVDSYSNTLGKVADADIGYPQYYGKHNRPFYHFPLDSTVTNLIAPFNISSENHVNSVFWINDFSQAIDLDSQNVFLMNGTWQQQSGSTNQVNLSGDFEIKGAGASDQRFWGFSQDGSSKTDLLTLLPDVVVDVTSAPEGTGYEGIFQGNLGYYTYTQDRSPITGSDYIAEISIRLNRDLSNLIESANHINLTAQHSFDTNISSLGMQYKFDVVSNFSAEQFDVGSFNFDVNSQGFSKLFSLDLSGVGSQILTKNFETYFRATTALVSDPVTYGRPNSGHITCAFSMELEVSLFPSAFKNYSIFSLPVNSSDIAITEKPIQIFESIIDQTSFSYNQDQSSASQVLTSSYNFQCVFSERKEINDIFEEFGKITKTNFWVGDNGVINIKTHQNSSSTIIDKTISVDDMIDFQIKDNPIGRTSYHSNKFNRFQVSYNFDFNQKVYKESLTAFTLNNSLCQVVNESRINKEKKVKTDYILETDTASYYLGNLIAFNTQEHEYVEIDLPARFFDIELFDVLEVNHPMIVGSSSLYKVEELNHDYLNGVVSVKSKKVIEVL